MEILKRKFLSFLAWSENYTETNMRYVIGGGSWLLGGKIALAFISFGLMFVFANWLPREIYGKYQYVIAIVSLFSLFTLPGIHTSLVKSVAAGKEGTLRLAVREKMKWGLLGSIFLLGFSAWYFLRENPVLGAAFLMAALFLPVLETFNIFLQFWNGRKRFDTQAKYEVFSAFLVALVLIAVIIYVNNNLLPLLAAFFIGQTFFNWLFYKRTLRQTTNSEEDFKAISFGKHLTIMNTFAVAAMHIDKVLIWKFLGAAEVAIYSFAWLPIQKIIGTIPLASLALPKLAELNIKERKRDIFKKFLKLFFGSTTLALFLIFAASLIYGLLLPQYTESIRYFQALSLLAIMIPFSFLNAALIADLRQKELYKVTVAPPVLKIILFLLLTPLYGIWGVVASLLITQVITSCLILFYFRKL